MDNRRRHTTLPYIPHPAKKELPDSEELTRDPEGSKKDVRPVFKQDIIVREPRYNHLYGPTRVLDSWRYEINEYVSGTITTSANAQATANVTLTNSPYLRLSRWPGARSVYTVLRVFALAPRATIATIGTLVCVYQDMIGGKSIPLGVFPSSSGGNDYLETLISTPITDTDVEALGQIQVTLNGTSPTTATYDWQIAFSFAYLLPELRGYDKPFYEVRGELDEKSLTKHIG